MNELLFKVRAPDLLLAGGGLVFLVDFGWAGCKVPKKMVGRSPALAEGS